MLKEDAHRGKGVHVLPAAEAVRAARRAGAARAGEGAGGAPGPGRPDAYDIVQQYLADQLTVDGRRFYIRCRARAPWPRPAGAPQQRFDASCCDGLLYCYAVDGLWLSSARCFWAQVVRPHILVDILVCCVSLGRSMMVTHTMPPPGANSCVSMQGLGTGYQRAAAARVSLRRRRGAVWAASSWQRSRPWAAGSCERPWKHAGHRRRLDCQPVAAGP